MTQEFERCNLDSGVAKFGGVGEGVFQLPALIDLVTDGEFHR